MKQLSYRTTGAANAPDGRRESQQDSAAETYTFDSYMWEHHCYDYFVYLRDQLAEGELSLGKPSREVPEPDVIELEDVTLQGMRFTAVNTETMRIQSCIRATIYISELCGHDPCNDTIEQYYKVNGTMKLCDEEPEISPCEDAHIYEGWDAPCGVPLNNRLIPCFGWDEQDAIAESLLAQYYPEALKKPTKIDPKVFAKRIGLTLEYAKFTPDGSVLGRLFEEDAEVTTYGRNGSPITTLSVKAKTGLVDADASKRSTGRVYPTIMHECYHHIAHPFYYWFQRMCRGTVQALSCPASSRATDGTDISLIERQTNQMVPRLSMPASTTKAKIEQLIIRKKKAYPNMGNLQVLEGVVSELAEFYSVSKQTAKLRMRELGYEEAEGVHNYYKKHYIPSYGFKPGTVGRNQTFTVTPSSVSAEYKRNPDFRKLLDTGHFIYVECHMCLNSSDYVQRSGNGTIGLTDYARNHMDECCLLFSYTSNSFSTAADGSLHREAAPIGGKVIFFPGKAEAEATAVKENFGEAALRISKIKKQLPRSLGDTLAFHMDRLGITKEELEERSQVSAKTIQHIRNRPDMKVSLSYVVALCVGLNLDPELSDDMVAKANLRFGDSEKDTLYQLILRSMYNSTIVDCNEILVQEGYQPLTRLAAAM